MQIKLNEYIIIDNMQDKIKQINDGLKKIRTAISNKGVVIPEDTPLSEYASRINEISRPTITIGQQVFVFYCNAEDNDELEMKIKPSVSWNNEFSAWDVTETIGGWTQSVPNPETDKYLYGLIISVTPGQSTSNEGFSWPRPIPIQGRNGEPGEKGDAGRDGVLVGATSYHTTLVYHKLTESETVDSVQISKDDIEYHVDSNAPFGPESIKINDELIINPESYWTTVLDPSSLTVCAIITYSVISKASEYVGKIDAVSEPFVLFGEQVKEQIVEYAINNDRNTIPLEWEETPGILTADNQYLWSRITTVYAVRDNKVSDPIIIAQYPKSIVGVDVKYGVSPDINTVPVDWESTFNQYENYTILWSKEITSYSDGTSNEVIKPIAFKGDPGISPIKILATIPSAELESWTLSHTDIENQSVIIVDKKTYVWHGTTNPSVWTNNYHSVEGTGVTYYWVDLGQWFSTEIPDWNVNNPEESGYIANRTHYEEYFSKIYSGTIDLENRTYSYIYTIPEGYDVNEVTITMEDLNLYDVSLPDARSGHYIANSFNDPTNGPVSWHLTHNPGKFIISCNKSITVPLNFELTVNYYKLVTLDPKFVPQIIEITYADLKALKDQSQLIPGMQYKIIDYETVAISKTVDAKFAEHPFDLIVTADSTNTINCKARAIQSARDIDGYFRNSDLSKWEIWYDFDNRDKYDWIPAEDQIAGVYDQDGTRYDLKVGQKKGVLNYAGVIANFYSTQNIYDDYEACSNIYETTGDFYIDVEPASKAKYKWYDWNSVFIPWVGQPTGWWDKLESEFGSDIRIRFDSSENVFIFRDYYQDVYQIHVTPEQVHPAKNNGDELINVYKLEDFEGNFEFYVTEDIVNVLQFLETRSPGETHGYSSFILAAEEDYNGESIGKVYHPTNGVVLPTYEGNDYFVPGIDVPEPYSNWIENDLIHKGTIYRMIDEHGNDCPYDFKNILLKSSEVKDHFNTDINGEWFYTFSLIHPREGVIYDGSIQEPEFYENNKIASCVTLAKKMNESHPSIPTGIKHLNGNIFVDYSSHRQAGIGNSFIDYRPHCSNNIFGEQCINNLILGEFSDNVLKKCSFNIFDNFNNNICTSIYECEIASATNSNLTNCSDSIFMRIADSKVEFVHDSNINSMEQSLFSHVSVETQCYFANVVILNSTDSTAFNDDNCRGRFMFRNAWIK